MKTFLRTIKVKYKLWMIVSVALIGMVALMSTSALSFKSALMHEKEVKTKHLIETAYGVLNYYHNLEETGKLSPAVARESAMNVIKNLRFGDNDYFWINDMQPRMIMHPIKPELDGKDLSDFKDPDGKKLFVAFVETVKRDKEGLVYYLWPKPGFVKPVPKVSYVKGFEPWGWVIGTGIYIDDVNALFRHEVSHSAAIFALITLLIISLSWFIAVNITRPLAEISEKVDHIADGDLRVSVHAEGGDEIGLLSGDVNKILLSIQQMIRDISGKTVQILNDATALTIHGKKVAQKVANDLERTSSAAAATEEMTATTNEISRNITTVSQKTEQARNVTAQGKAIVQQTIASITEVNQHLDMAAEKVKIMAEFSRKIDDILGTINKIADQTNLLALNAAIEAARAGDQGRGFAVVADEVRKLAQGTANATSDINNILSSIRTGTEDATQMMVLAVEKAKVTGFLAGRMDDSFESIYQSFENVSNMVEQVVSAAEEQSTTAEDISHNLSGISKDARESTQTIQEMILSFNRFGVGAKEFLKLLNNYSDPILRVRILKADYVLWIHRVMDLFDKKETLYLPEEFSPERSRMGRWLHGEGRDLFGGLNAFRELSSPHQQLHESGRQVYEALKKNDKETVDRTFTKDLAAQRRYSGDHRPAGGRVPAGQCIRLTDTRLYLTTSSRPLTHQRRSCRSFP